MFKMSEMTEQEEVDALEQIYKIALRVRKVCVALANDKLSIHMGMDFQGMDDLSCMCGCASWILRNELRRHGFRTQLKWGEVTDLDGGSLGGHCWVKWREYYIDITATQFEGFMHEYDDPNPFGREVLIFSEYDDLAFHYHYGPKTIRTLADFKLNYWPDSQSPAAFAIKPEVRKFVQENLKKVA